MAGRNDLIIAVGGDTSGFERSMKSARQSASVFERELKKAEAAEARRSKAMGDLGRSAMLAGAAMAAGMALAVRSASQWESAWAGVTKTVDGSAAQMGVLEGELRELAKVLPASHREIAAVAEAAGQLGVRREDIAAFTRVMIDLGETTNLTADEAATAVAQISNVMGTSAGDVDNLASTLVALGNAGASTEKQILDMSLRLAGAGKLVGASEGEVLALANALASMGIEAELGGGAMSRTLLNLYGSVKGGGAELEAFAEIAGSSASDFAAAFQSDPMRAVDAFVQGLNRIDASGGDVMGTLSELGITGTHDLQVLLRLKGAGDLLAGSLDLQAEAWEANNALAAEAQKRYDTTEAKTQLAKNAINDLAITLGSTLLPAVGAAAGKVSDLAGWLGQIPAPAQTAFAVLGTLGATVGLVGGAGMIGASKLATLKGSLETLGVSAATTEKTMRRLSNTMKGGLIAAAIVGVALAVDQLVNALGDPTPGVNALSEDLVDFAKSGRVAGDLAKGVGKDFSDLQKTIKLAGRNKWSGSIMGEFIDPRKVDDARDFLVALDQAFANFVASGNTEIVGAALAQSGMSVEKFADAFPQYAEAVRGASVDSKLAADDIAGIGGAAAGAVGGVEELTEAQQGLQRALESFVDPLQAYQDILNEVNAEERERAEKAAEAHNASVDDKITALQREYDARLDSARKTEGISDAAIHKIEDKRDAEVDALQETKKSWEDYATGVDVSLTKVAERLEQENAARRQWRENLIEVARKVGPEVAQILADMGEDGIGFAAAMADGTTAHAQRMAAALIEQATLGGQGARSALEDELLVMATYADTGGKATVQALAGALNMGVDQVREAAKRLGLVIAEELPSGVRIGGEFKVSGSTSPGGFAAGGYLSGPGVATAETTDRLGGDYLARPDLEASA